MKRRTQQFIAAFAATCIGILGLCGFMLVDLRADSRLAEESGALFAVSEITSEGISFAALGEEYFISSAQFESAREMLWSWRGFLPGSVGLTAGLAARGYLAASDYLEADTQPEEPW